MTGSLDDVLEDEVFPEILEAVAELDELPDAARPEAWASSMLAIWRQPGCGVVPADGDRRLVDWVVATATTDPRAVTVAAALRAVIDDARLDALVGASTDPPVWASAVGTAEAIGAARLRLPAGEAIAVRYRHADGYEHCLLADLDGDRLGGLAFGPALDDLVDGADHRLHVEPVETAAAIATVVAAWQAADAADLGDDVAMNEVLARRRLATGLRREAPGTEVAAPRDPLVADATPAAPSGPGTTPAGSAPAGPAPAGPAPAAGAGLPVPPGGSESSGEAGSSAGPGRSARIEALVAPTPEPMDGAPGRDPEADRWARDLLVGTLGADRFGHAPPTMAEAIADLVRPTGMAARPLAERDALGALEWADWLGVALGVARRGAGQPADGHALVDLINRCPEVTSTIPKREREYYAWAFSVALADLAVVGAVADGVFTADGVHALLDGLLLAWAPDPGT